MSKTYYFINDNVNPDAIYGNGNPVCIDRAETDRLSGEWECDLMEQMHEASEEEIDQYGKYDS